MKFYKSFALSFFALLFITTSFSSVNAQKKGDNFGIGVMLGEPTGISIKKWTGDITAFDLGAAWSLGGKNEALHLHSDFLLHKWFQDNENLAFYYGIGGRVILDDDAHAGIRFPLGLNYVFENAPFDFFLEAVPIFDLTPDTEFAGNGAIGMRFYF